MSVTSTLNLFFRNDVIPDTITSTGAVAFAYVAIYVINLIQANSIDQNLSIVPLVHKNSITAGLINRDNNKFLSSIFNSSVITLSFNDPVIILCVFTFSCRYFGREMADFFYQLLTLRK